MATIPLLPVEYPTSDGKPMAETDVHRELLTDLIETLKRHFEADPQVYVSGNLILCYQEGDNARSRRARRPRHPRNPQTPQRDNYLLWEEGKPPDIVFELTSKSTREEDEDTKFVLYRDTIQVPEYFLFDPYEEYLRPAMKGYRLVDGEYVSIEPVNGRLPSASLGLELERDGTELRLFDPATGRRVLTPRELAKAAEAARKPPRPKPRVKPPRPPTPGPRPRVKPSRPPTPGPRPRVKPSRPRVKPSRPPTPRPRPRVKPSRPLTPRPRPRGKPPRPPTPRPRLPVKPPRPARQAVEAADAKAEAARQAVEAADAKAETARLRLELEALKERLGEPG